MPNQPTARLTHDQIRNVTSEHPRNVKDRLCRCGGHLTLFGKDDFGCKGGQNASPCDPKHVAAWLHGMINPERAEAPEFSQPEPQDTPSGPGMSAVEYAMAKYLPLKFLEDFFWVREGKHPYYSGLGRAVEFPYKDEKGTHVTSQWRWGMGGKQRRFLSKKPTYLYGGIFLQNLARMAEAGNARETIFIVEGESNTQTLASNGYAVLGLPGVGNWKQEWASMPLFKQATQIFFFLDMKDGKPEGAAILGARKVAECFAPGKVRAVKLPAKDASELWLHHMTGPDDNFLLGPANGSDGFRKEIERALFAAKPVIPEVEYIEGRPADIGDEVLNACPLLKDFIDMTLPKVESDINNLVCDFLACAGAAIGLKASHYILNDKHTPATFHLLIGDTAVGKGTAWGCADAMFERAVSDWPKHVRRSARSQQALYRMLNEVSEREITKTDSKGEVSTTENKRYADGNLLLRFAEVSAVFKSIRAEWSTLSQGLREAFDGTPLSNERSQADDSISVSAPYTATVLGDVTPWELGETISSVDFANGIANRFIWCTSRRTKTLPRPGPLPDYSELAARLARLIPSDAIDVPFSDEGAKAWDSWVYTIPLEESGRLGSACGRMRANALRLAVLFAVLDERRPKGQAITIDAAHVKAAGSILDRHKATVAWFLERPVALPPGSPVPKDKAWQNIEKVRGAMVNGQITGSQLYKLFSNQTADERKAIAQSAGLQEMPEADSKGNRTTVWR